MVSVNKTFKRSQSTSGLLLPCDLFKFPPGNFPPRELHPRKFLSGKITDRNYELTEMISFYNFVLFL